MSKERLNEIKDSVNFQKEFLLAHNMNTLCVDEEQELIEEIYRLNNIIDELEKYLNQEIIEWQDASDLWTKAQVQEDRIVLDKLKELKENK